MKKPSFLDRLTGGGQQAEEYDRILDDKHQFGEDDDLAVEETEQEEEWERIMVSQKVSEKDATGKVCGTVR